MIFYPAKDEILVFALSNEEIKNILISELTSPEKRVFNGWIEGENFQIARKSQRPDNFIPIMKGSIDSTSKGSLVFMSYRLLYSTRMFLLLWSVILLLLCLFFILRYEAYLYGAIAFVVGVINYLVVYFNFKKQIRISKEAFINLVELPN